jgi:hypothetical protein
MSQNSGRMQMFEIIMAINSRRMNGRGMGEMRNAYKILVGNLKGTDHSNN